MICPNCGAEVEDGSLDCYVCGYQFEYEETEEADDYYEETAEGMECPFCGSLIAVGSAVCPVCQAELAEAEEAAPVIREAQPAASAAAAASAKTSKGPVIAIVSVLAAAAIGIGIYAFASRSKDDKIVQDSGLSSEAESVTADGSADSEQAVTAATTTAPAVTTTAVTTTTPETTTTAETTTSVTTTVTTTTSVSKTTTTKATSAQVTTPAVTPVSDDNVILPQPASRLASSRRKIVNTNSSNLNIRCGPGAGYATLLDSAGIPKGTAVDVYAIEYDAIGTVWDYVSYNGRYGWCMDQYLAEDVSAKAKYANDFINLPYSEITVRYLNDSYDQEMVSMGQYGIMGYKNTSVLPYYIFAFSESYEAIGWNLYLKQNPAGIHVLPNGYINSEIKVGMTYNELKNKLHFEGVQNDADEFGWRVWVRIDGVLWGISFDLPKAKADELSAKTAELAPTIDDPRPKFDVSDVNPKSSRAFYLRDLQNWNP